MNKQTFKKLSLVRFFFLRGPQGLEYSFCTVFNLKKKKKTRNPSLTTLKYLVQHIKGKFHNKFCMNYQIRLMFRMLLIIISMKKSIMPKG